MKAGANKTTIVDTQKVQFFGTELDAKWYAIDLSCFFFFNETATTEIYTLSLHDALPISSYTLRSHWCGTGICSRSRDARPRDRKSTRLNSSHEWISYAVFCLKKKKN